MGDLLGSPRVASLSFLLRHATTGYVRRNILIILFWTVGGLYAVVNRGFASGELGGVQSLKIYPARHSSDLGSAEHVGCDHTSTKAPDPIRTPKLSVLGRERSEERRVGGKCWCWMPFFFLSHATTGYG